MKIAAVTWIGWLGATAVAAAVLVSFAYTNFATKAEARDQQDTITHRLDRLEGKIDAILERQVKAR